MTADRRVGSRRLDALDAARGLAMLGVCVSHLRMGIQHGDPAFAKLLARAGMFASPMFILVSGTLLGYLLANRGDGANRLRIRLIDRGLFLLIVVHAATVLAFYLYGFKFGDAVAMEYMTDAIGISLIVGAAAVPRMSVRARLVIAGVLYVVGWTLVLAWHPAGDVVARVKEALIGASDQYAKGNDFPLAIWFAIYLAATPVGEYLATRQTSSAREALGRRLLWVGPAAIAAAIAVKSVYLFVRPVAWPDVESMPALWRNIYDLTTPFDKYPPGPVYLLAFGGVATALVGGLLLAVERGWFTRLIGAAAVVGRASMFVFVLQWFVYLVLVPRLPVPSRFVLIPYFALTVGGLWIAAWGWGRIGGNRFITVGLRAFADRRRALEAQPARAVAVEVEAA